MLRQYDVVNSTPLGAMQGMHLEGLNLNWRFESAIQSLGYRSLVRSWRALPETMNEHGISKGGAGKTDLPIWCCVYPSYRMNDNTEEPSVLLISHCWLQGAERLGAFIGRQSPDGEDGLEEVLTHDLARLYAKTKDKADYYRPRKTITENYLDHFAYDWGADPYSLGASAYFGPG